MSRASEILAITYAFRRAEYGNPKSAARARWARRRKWQTRKDPNRRATGRK